MATNYANDILEDISEDGMTNELWELVHKDLGKLSQIEVNNHKERNLYFYLEHFIDDLCDEFKCSIIDKDEIITNAFNKLRDKEKVDLTDIRSAVFSAINKKRKVAYPNIKGTHDENAIPQYDVNKWVTALSNIYAAVRSGENRKAATETATEGWSPMEKFNFENWVRYYENADHEKYGLQKSAAGTIVPVFPNSRQPWEKPSEKLENMPMSRGPGRPRQLTKTPEQDKQDLLSRLDSAMKILRRLAKIWPKEVWQRLFNELTNLQGEITTLKTTATMVDCIIKTANRLNRSGFSDGAQILIKIAQPPGGGDIATKIERALSGRGPEDPAEAAPLEGGDLGAMPGAEMPPMPPGGDMGMPAGPEGAPPPPAPPGGADLTMAPPAGVEENLPPPETPPPAPPVEEPAPSGNADNPFEGKQLTVQDVLGVLEPLAKRLSEREFVRALSKADMMLDSMNIASHFPELGEAQAKALELNIYVGTRIDKIINKLKGGLKGEGKEETGGPPEVEMSEFAGGPPKEQEMFEVSEEEAAGTPPAATPPAPGAPAAPPAPEAAAPAAPAAPPVPGV